MAWNTKKYDRAVGQLLHGEVLDGKIEEAIVRLKDRKHGARRLNVIYKASKQLSDLCWQEIKRRREK